MMNPVGICNMALGFFGAVRIASIDDDKLDSDEAALCNAFYEPMVRAVLEERAWLFATGFIDLGAAVNSPYASLPAGGSGFPLASTRPLVSQFNLPATVVRPIACDDGSGQFQIEWERNGQVILSESTAQLLCKAVIYNPDPNTWTPNFALTVAYKLASVIAAPISSNSAKAVEFEKQYEIMLKKAANLDGMAGATTQKLGIKSESLANRRG